MGRSVILGLAPCCRTVALAALRAAADSSAACCRPRKIYADRSTQIDLATIKIMLPREHERHKI